MGDPWTLQDQSEGWNRKGSRENDGAPEKVASRDGDRENEQ